MPAELVDVRLVPGLDATTRSLATAGVGADVVLSAMAGCWSCPRVVALLVAEAELHRAWSNQRNRRRERRGLSLGPVGATCCTCAVGRHLVPRLVPMGLRYSYILVIRRRLLQARGGHAALCRYMARLCCAWVCTDALAGRLRVYLSIILFTVVPLNMQQQICYL